MTVQELLTKCDFRDSDMAEIRQIHPKQFISDEIKIPIWKIRYSYLTSRGNEKTAEKYVSAAESDWDVVEPYFMEHMREFNEKFQYKAVSNVKILDMSYMGEMYLPVE